MEYQIEIRDLDPVRIAYMTFQGSVSEANTWMPKVFKSIRGKQSGAPFFQYITMDPMTKTGLLELCVPTEMEPSGSGVDVKVLPQCRALCVMHVGSYETLYRAYEAIEAYAKEHALILQPPFREVYIKGPGMFLKGNPDNYITEIQFPIQEKTI